MKGLRHSSSVGSSWLRYVQPLTWRRLPSCQFELFAAAHLGRGLLYASKTVVVQALVGSACGHGWFPGSSHTELLLCLCRLARRTCLF